MADSVTSESKHILKRVLVGVLTAVVTTATIYFLGFNRSEERASAIEIKKNTIKVWKDFVKLENELQPKHDSSLARVRRGAYTLPQYRAADSIIGNNFIIALTKLSETGEIDREFKLMLQNRIEYKKLEMENFYNYYNEFNRIGSQPISLELMNEEIQELNTQHDSKRNNFIERVGRGLEDVTEALAKKYKYPFSIKEFHFNLFYQTLKTAKQRKVQLPEEPAPSDPNKLTHGLPE